MSPLATTTNLTDDQILQYRDLVLHQFAFTRQYTLQLLEDLDPDQWNVIPLGAPSNLAWQVGHLAVAQYGLMLFRQRGRAAGDLDLMPGWLRKRFGRGSIPPTDPAEIPSRDELLSMLHRIDATARSEVSVMPASQFSEPTDMPYAVYPNRLGALLFCPIHESIHIGQIGMIRRMLGRPPMR